MYINTSKDNSGKMVKTGKYGKVRVEVFRDKYRLRFSHLSKRHSITIGDISDESWRVACAKAQEINLDILMERFDDTLAKYSPERAKALEVLEQKSKVTLKQVWKNYKKLKDNIVQPSTKKHCWSQVDKCNEQLVELLNNAPRIENEHNLIFPSITGEYINHGNWSKRYWRPLVKGLVKDGKVHKYLKPYSTRHSGITRLIRLGYDPATVAALAGTSTEMICNNYLAAHNEIDLPIL